MECIYIYEETRPDLPWEKGDVNAIAEAAWPGVDLSEYVITLGSEGGSVPVRFIQKQKGLEKETLHLATTALSLCAQVRELGIFDLVEKGWNDLGDAELRVKSFCLGQVDALTELKISIEGVNLLPESNSNISEYDPPCFIAFCVLFGIHLVLEHRKSSDAELCAELCWVASEKLKDTWLTKHLGL